MKCTVVLYLLPEINRKSLKRKMTEAEYMDATPEIDAKVAKISAPESHYPASDMITP